MHHDFDSFVKKEVTQYSKRKPWVLGITEEERSAVELAGTRKVTSRWAGEEKRGVDRPASPCRVNHSTLQRETLLSLDRLGKQRLQPSNLHAGESRLLPGNSARVPSDPAPPSSDGSACRAQSFRLSLAMPTHSTSAAPAHLPCASAPQWPP